MLARTVLLMLFAWSIPAEARDLTAVHASGVWDVEYSSDGNLLATSGGDGVVRIWDAASLAPVSSFVASVQGFDVYDVHFLPDNRHVVTAVLAGDPAVWDAKTGTLVQVLKGHHENVVRVAHSQDGSLLYTAGSDDYVFAWDLQTLDIVGRYPVKSPVGIVPLDKAGRILVVALGGVYAADVLSGTTMGTWTKSPYYFAAAAAGKNQALVGGSITEGARPVLLDVQSGQESTPFAGFTSGFVWNMAVAPVTALAAASIYQGQAIAWNLSQGGIVYDSQNETGKSLSVAFSPSGRELAVGDTDGSVHFIDVTRASR